MQFSFKILTGWLLCLFFLDLHIAFNCAFIVALCLKPEIKHGKLSVDKHSYTESESVTIQCDSGYRMEGLENITCSENRTWYPEVPKCEWVSDRIQKVF